MTNDLENTADNFFTAEFRRVPRKVPQSFLLILSILSGSLSLLSGTLRLNFPLKITQKYLMNLIILSGSLRLLSGSLRLSFQYKLCKLNK
jgi:hypothetical protein